MNKLCIVIILIASVLYFSISYVTATEIDMGIINVANGTIVMLNLDTIPYGGVAGTVKLKLGSHEWYPDSIWLVPEGMDVKSFNYTGNTYRVPTELNMTNNCISSIYTYNGKHAYKVNVKEGKFCILADGGKYKIKAVY